MCRVKLAMLGGVAGRHIALVSCEACHVGKRGRTPFAKLYDCWLHACLMHFSPIPQLVLVPDAFAHLRYYV